MPPTLQLAVLTFKCVGAALATLAHLTCRPTPGPGLNPGFEEDEAALSGSAGSENDLSMLLTELTSVADLERECSGAGGVGSGGGGSGGGGRGGGGTAGGGSGASGVLPTPLVGYVIHSCLQAATTQVHAGTAGWLLKCEGWKRMQLALLSKASLLPGA